METKCATNISYDNLPYCYLSDEKGYKMICMRDCNIQKNCVFSNKILWGE
jgi:hypothetical protein